MSVMSPTLSETIDPEEKRKIIGDTFMELANYVLKDELKLDMTDVLLCQGMIFPFAQILKIVARKRLLWRSMLRHYSGTMFSPM